MGRGSRSGGGRSSFGGGGRSSFSGGGRSFRSGPRSSFGGYHGGHRHTHVHIGHGRHHHYYVGGASVSPKTALLIILFFFTFFFGVIGLANSSSVNYHKESIQIAQDDYYFYQNMIDYAKEHRNEGYIVEATVITGYYDEEVGKNYLIYKVDGINKEFETFSVYSREEAYSYPANSKIEVALSTSKYVMNNKTDSIDMNFENVEFEDFSLYIQAKKALNGARVGAYIPLGIAACLIGVAIFVIVKPSKKDSEDSTSESTTETKETVLTCRYCGSVHEAGKRKCSSCGASLKK